jgi:hypothetical protein
VAQAIVEQRAVGQAGQRVVEGQLLDALGLLQARQLRALALDRRGDLRGHELQQRLVAFAVAHAAVVALHHQRADGAVAGYSGTPSQSSDSSRRSNPARPASRA